MEQLFARGRDDFRYCRTVYAGPELHTFPVEARGLLGRAYRYAEFDGGRYLESCYQPFAGSNTPKTSTVAFPTADWFDYSSVGPAARSCPPGRRHLLRHGRGHGFSSTASRAPRGTDRSDRPCHRRPGTSSSWMRGSGSTMSSTGARWRRPAAHRFTHIGERPGDAKCSGDQHGDFRTAFAPKLDRYFRMVHSYGARP